MRAAALALLLCTACAGKPATSLPRYPVSFAVPALDGGTIDIGHYRGRVVVLHFFATWDMISTRDVEQLKTAGAGVEVIGIALDVDGRALVAPWRDALAVPYLIGLATPAVRSGQTVLGRIEKVPTTIVLDRNGVQIARIERGLEPGELARLIARARARR